ncbi:MAG: CAP domain-containing protein, partial [Bacteroidota bacterium]
PFHMGFTYKQIANEIVRSWERSPKHNQNLLNPNFKSAGLGIKVYDYNYKGSVIELMYTTLQLM